MNLAQMERTAAKLGRPTGPVDELPNIWADLDFVMALEASRWQERARALRWKGDPVATAITGKWCELISASTAPGTAKNTFTAEVQINDTAGMGIQAVIPGRTFGLSKSDVGRGIRIIASGILSSTATPTYTLTARGGAAASTSACRLLGSAALTTVSGAANAFWRFEGDAITEILAAGGASSTIRGTGMIHSGGLASPFAYPLYGGGASPGTDATFDHSVDNFINFNVACSASSASNTITLQQLLLIGIG